MFGHEHTCARHQRMKRDDKFARRLQVNTDKLDDVLQQFAKLGSTIKVGQMVARHMDAGRRCS